jgi:hypothetical protein
VTTEIIQLTWEERTKAISMNLQQTLQNAGAIEETVKARLEDPGLSAKAKAGLRQILRTSNRLKRTLKSKCPG